MITKTHAELIAKKLEAELKQRSGHELAIVRYNGRAIAHFGIRRGSRKDQGHDHIPGQIHLGDHDCLELGRCSMTREQWIERLKEKGLIGA